MLTRRHFLSLPGAVAGIPVSQLGAQRVSVATSESIPPSVAALTSMRDRAKPITDTERRGRIERAKKLMAQNKVDAILLTAGTSLEYFTGIRWGESERLFAAVLPREGSAFLVCPAFEEDRVREQAGSGPLGDAEVLAWQEDESPFERIRQGLRDRRIASGRLGLSEKTPFVFADGIAAAAPSLHVTSATPVTAACRMIKDSHELELIRLANEATYKCYEAVYRALTPGLTENDVRRFVDAGYTRLGFSGFVSVQVGENTALPHGSIAPQTIREGTIIMLDDGCRVEGYVSDITRTFVIGKPTDKMMQVFEVVRRAQTAALRAARPGASLESIDAAARRVIDAAGYGPGFKYFTHRVGHGIGMDEHEWPYLVRNNMFGWDRSLRLEPGMVFSDEPGIYIRGEFGIRLEDDMYITDHGAELFTSQSPSIEKPFG
jgi:Xaa-Pro dipeptidase